MSGVTTQPKLDRVADNSAVLRSAYKQVTAGLVPEDWPMQQLGTVCDVRDGTHESPRFHSEGVPLVTSKNIVNGHLDLENISYISEQDAREINKRSKVESNDILISMIGTIGSAVLVDFEPRFCIKNVALVKPRRVLPTFLIQLIGSPQFQGYLNDSLDGGIQKFIALGTLRRLNIPVPPLAEQRAIAEALSAVDGLLGVLETLIAKEGAIKQAAMQQLLTGKTRLPGFSGAWETKQIADLFAMRVATSKTRHIEEGGSYLIMDMGSVSRDGRLIASKATNYKGDFLARGDLVMPKDDIGGGNIIGKVAYIDADNRYVLGDHVYALRAKVGDPLFFSYLINRYETNSSLRSKVGGSAQLGLSRTAVLEEEIPIPAVGEQQAVATVLSGIDAQIAALEWHRDKIRAIKQGMLQQLLTGRVRLVRPQVAADA
jgi:type I restriction enzyme S subunit